MGSGRAAKLPGPARETTADDAKAEYSENWTEPDRDHGYPLHQGRQTVHCVQCSSESEASLDQINRLDGVSFHRNFHSVFAGFWILAGLPFPVKSGCSVWDERGMP
jgi:hypothetical protein